MQENNNITPSSTIQVRKPKRIIHCSDGIYEEYSDEEDDIMENPKDMSLFRRIGHSIIFGLDYLGEGLANILNITTPKYAYEIEHFKRTQELREKERQEEKDNSWNIGTGETKNPITEAPKNNDASVNE